MFIILWRDGIQINESTVFTLSHHHFVKYEFFRELSDY